VIVDFKRFVESERPYWEELEGLLDKMERDLAFKMDLATARRLHYLYQRASADLARFESFPSAPRARENLSALVARAYAEIHETRDKPRRLAPIKWFFVTFPRVFRKHSRAFALVVAITAAGAAFGSLSLYIDPDSKAFILPFPHLMGDPSDRVAWEESANEDRLDGGKSTFSAMLMTHNTKVSILTMGLGMTWGIGTILLLFYNGVILGAVCFDYALAGEGRFLAGWLLPHGAVEIPAILIAGQAGLTLGKALIGWGTSDPVRARLRAIGPDLVTLIGGVAAMLVWAGIVEAFFSQYHEPVLPYWLKISFGAFELAALALFLSWSGRKGEDED